MCSSHVLHSAMVAHHIAHTEKRDVYTIHSGISDTFASLSDFVIQLTLRRQLHTHTHTTTTKVIHTNKY